MAVATGPSQKPVLTESFLGSGDLSTKQFYFVKMTANPREVIICNNKADKPVGVLQNKPAAGETAEVMVIGRTKVSSDVALNEGDAIGPSGDGQAEAKTQTTGGDTAEYVAGTVTAASGAAAEMAEALINCATPLFIQI